MYQVKEYTITPAEQTCIMHIGAEVVSARMFNGELCIYALVDTNAGMEQKDFQVIAAGQEVDEIENLRFIDTVTLETEDGYYVMHVFEVQ